MAWVLEELMNLKLTPVYNDYDVFLEYHNDDSLIKNVDINYNLKKGNHSIVHTSRYGLINKIFYISKKVSIDNPESSIFPLDILNEFDLNCVQVGVDLSTEKIFFTPQFEKFLQHQELQFTKLRTPSHSAIRYFKKREELGVYGDDEKAMGLIAVVIETGKSELLKPAFSDLFNPCSGKEMEIKFEKYSNIKKYMEIIHKVLETCPIEMSINELNNTNKVEEKEDRMFLNNLIKPNNLALSLLLNCTKSDIELIKNSLENLAIRFYNFKPAVVFSEDEDNLAF